MIKQSLVLYLHVYRKDDTTPYKSQRCYASRKLFLCNTSFKERKDLRHRFNATAMVMRSGIPC